MFSVDSSLGEGGGDEGGEGGGGGGDGGGKGCSGTQSSSQVKDPVAQLRLVAMGYSRDEGSPAK